MISLKTTYMGLKLKNPILVASSSLTKSLEALRRCEEAGAGGVIIKSLFEEQLRAEANKLEGSGPSWHTEAHDYVHRMSMELGPEVLADLISEAKKKLSIPVIASLNCVSPPWWVQTAEKLQKAGADGLELNVAAMPSDPASGAKDVEGVLFRIVEEVRSRVSIPIAVKIGPYYSSLAAVASELDRRGVSALVLFNRFYQVDIDTEKVALKPGYHFSSEEEITLPLRWIALLHNRVKCSLSASTGVHDGLGAVKMILAGASTVQLCSTLYMNGLQHIAKVLEEMESWMAKHKFGSIDDFRGILAKKKGEKTELWDRLQYIQALVGID